MKKIKVLNTHKLKKVQVTRCNDKYIYSGKGDEAIKIQFDYAMKKDNQKRKEFNAPIAKYDAVNKLAYLEYPDGRIEYARKA